MKTSNIILTFIIGSISFLLVTGILQNRYFIPANARSGGDYNLESHAIDLPAFRYLVIRNEDNVEIISPGKNQIIVRYAPGDSIPGVTYHVTGDTLYVGNSSDSLRNNAYSQLSVPTMDRVVIKSFNSHFRFGNFCSSRISLILDKSMADLSDGHGQDLKELYVQGYNESQVNSGTFHVDSLRLQLDDSKAFLPLNADNLGGTIKNNSELNIKDVGHFDFTKDESSRLTHWN